MSKRWQKVEIAFLKKHTGDKSLAQLAERLHTDPATVAAKLEELRGGGAKAAAVIDSVDHYKDGMAALYAGEWERAATLLESVTSEGYGELAARAAQFAAVARQRMADAPPEDPWLRAVYEKNRGHYDDALAVCADEGRCESDGRFAYLAAVLQTLRGDLDAARGHLERAVALDPHNRAHALHDPDLRPLREPAEPAAEGG
jgi:tetratricopeptide (TPR) repeat protein